MSRKREASAMSRDEILETMRFLGWITHDEKGNVTDEAFEVSRRLTGCVVESVMLGSRIASEVDAYRAELKAKQ